MTKTRPSVGFLFCKVAWDRWLRCCFARPDPVALSLQLEQTRGKLGSILGLPNATIGMAGLATATSALGAPVIIGASSSGVVNGSIQYIKYGDIKYPAELASSVVFGGVGGPLMANSNIYWNTSLAGGFATLNSAFVNNYYSVKERAPDSLVESFVFGALGGSVGKVVDDYLVRNWISGIPQYINSSKYNPNVGALLNARPSANLNYSKAVLVKDTVTGNVGTLTENISKEAWEKAKSK